MAKILMSAGPIPAMLDSVKIVTNRFKGGLALKTAEVLYDMGHSITVVKWKHTKPLKDSPSGIKYINISDVREYYEKMKNLSIHYDAVVLAGAIANLMPVYPWKGKFPSHEYKEGDTFDIKFTITPRLIDIIKEMNPRCCLIGYKMFDSPNDEKLIDIAKHTLKDSKANVIFANTPEDAKFRKIAVLSDDSSIPMSFDEHIQFIHRAITQKYFVTNIIDTKGTASEDEIQLAKCMVKQFLMTTDGFGSIAIRLSDKSMITTGRGHRDISRVFDVDIDKRVISANTKATLNAPMLWSMTRKHEIVIHRHEVDEYLPTIPYCFPGTLQEVMSVHYDVNIQYHGYVKEAQFKPIDWITYRSKYPKKYMETNDAIMKYLGDVPIQSLEVGSNSKCICTYSLDPNYKHHTAINITYEDLEKRIYKPFDLILLRNSINYLSMHQIKLLQRSLSRGGKIVANTFKSLPKERINEDEIAISLSPDKVKHVLRKGDEYYVHCFSYLSRDFFKDLGFTYDEISKTSVVVTYENVENLQATCI